MSLTKIQSLELINDLRIGGVFDAQGFDLGDGRFIIREWSFYNPADKVHAGVQTKGHFRPDDVPTMLEQQRNLHGLPIQPNKKERVMSMVECAERIKVKVAKLSSMNGLFLGAGSAQSHNFLQQNGIVHIDLRHYHDCPTLNEITCYPKLEPCMKHKKSLFKGESMCCSFKSACYLYQVFFRIHDYAK